MTELTIVAMWCSRDRSLAEVWGMGKAMVRRRQRGTGRRTRCGLPVLWSELFGCLTPAEKAERARIAEKKARPRVPPVTYKPPAQPGWNSDAKMSLLATPRPAPRPELEPEPEPAAAAAAAARP